MNKISFAAAVALILTAFAGTQARAENDACRADVQKFCKDVKPGGRRIIDCLKQHESQLSEGCKGRGAQAKKKGQAFRAACASDHEKFCKEVRPGAGRIIACLKKHQSALSANCGGFVSRAPAGIGGGTSGGTPSAPSGALGGGEPDWDNP